MKTMAGSDTVTQTFTKKVFAAALGLCALFSPGFSFATANPLSFENYLELHYRTSDSIPEIPPHTIVIPTSSPTVSYSVKPKPVPLPNAKVSYTFKVPLPEVSVDLSPGNPYQGSSLAFELHHLEEAYSLPDFPGKKLARYQDGKYKGKIAIIIDDIGNHASLDKRVALLPGAVTLAILPHTPHSKSVAEVARQNHKEIMLHAPMENEFDRPLGPGALTKDLSKEDFIEVLQESIDAIPHISGINNHMGSLLTQNQQAMNWVMQTVEKNKLFFVDSRTTAESVANKVARNYNIQHTSRNVFLDNEQTQEYIDKAFRKTLAISEKTGFALAIGHPYPATVSYLEKVLPDLEKQGFELIVVSRYMTEKSRHYQAKRQAEKLAKK